MCLNGLRQKKPTALLTAVIEVVSLSIVSQILIAVLPTVVTGVVLGWWSHLQKKQDEERAEREIRRLQSEKLRISLLVAAAKLSYATAVAMKRGYANGEVEDGIKQYQEAMRDFKNFERELVAKQVVED